MTASDKAWNGTAATQSVLALSKTTGAARTLMVAIAAHADSEGRAFPSISRIARLANITERHAKGILKTLPADEIEIEHRGGRGHSNRYRILLEKVNWSSPFVDGEKVKSNALKGEICGTEKVKSVAVKGEPQFTRIDSNKQIEETGRLVGQPTHLPDSGEYWETEEEWMKGLEARFPGHDVEGELRRFQDHCRRKGNSANRRGFEAWMDRASPAIRGKPEEVEKW